VPADRREPDAALSYDDMRRLTALNALTREFDARTNAAILSELDRAEKRGEPVPGWAEVVERAKARLVGD
jgi:hypothetical protein